MGADMLIIGYAIQRGREPDWDRAREAAEKIDYEQESYVRSGTDLEEVRGKLDELETAFTRGDRELGILDLADLRLYVTGGMSWGDSPTELWSAFELPSPVIRAAGFVDGLEHRAHPDPAVMGEQTDGGDRLRLVNDG
jgi:hypothetical protein